MEQSKAEFLYNGAFDEGISPRDKTIFTLRRGRSLVHAYVGLGRRGKSDLEPYFRFITLLREDDDWSHGQYIQELILEIVKEFGRITYQLPDGNFYQTSVTAMGRGSPRLAVVLPVVGFQTVDQVFDSLVESGI